MSLTVNLGGIRNLPVTLDALVSINPNGVVATVICGFSGLENLALKEN